MVKKAEQQKQEFYKKNPSSFTFQMNDKLPKCKPDYGVIKSAVDPDGTSDFALSTSEKSKQPISEIDPEQLLHLIEVEPIEHKIVEIPMAAPIKCNI